MIVFMAHSLSTGEYTDLSIEGAYFQPGEEKEVRTQIKVNLSPGRYVLAAYSVVSDGLYFIKGTEVFVTVEGVPTGIHPLAVDDKLRVLYRWFIRGDLCVESPYRTGLGGEENSIVTGTGKF